MIKLVDLINMCGVTLPDFKIHCALGKNPTPVEMYFAGSFKQWQEFQTRPNFNCQKILSLIQLGPDRWLFAGVFNVFGCKKKKEAERVVYIYNTEEAKGLESLAGRTVVRFPKNFRATYLRGEKHINNITVLELREERMTVGDFPGYSAVRISHEILQTIVRQVIPTWKSALASVSGIYLITDTLTGKHYVGKASGGEGIWNRWRAYAKDGHGGNKELRDLLRKKKPAYAENFQYTILEVFDLNTTEAHAFEREVHWKNVLLTREFGYNAN